VFVFCGGENVCTVWYNSRDRICQIARLEMCYQKSGLHRK